MFSDNQSSSPDPIALTPTPSPRKLRSRTINNTPLAGGSANRQRKTPSRSVAFETPASNGTSPWKIKVTVEAEPHSQDADAENPSPSQTAYIRSRSTKVPLKYADDFSQTKSKRGRPAKKGNTPTRGRKRNGTPVRRRRSKGQEDEDTRGTQPVVEAEVSDTTPTISQGGQKKTLLSMLSVGDSDSLGDASDPLFTKNTSTLRTNALSDRTLSRPPMNSQSCSTDLESRFAQGKQRHFEALAEVAHDSPESSPQAMENETLIDSAAPERVPGDETVFQSEGFSFVSVPSLSQSSEHEKNMDPEFKTRNIEDHTGHERGRRQCGSDTNNTLNLSKGNLLPAEDMPSVPDFSSLKSTPIHGNTIKMERESDRKVIGHSELSEPDISSAMSSSPPIPILGLPSPSRVTPTCNITPCSQPPALVSSCPSKEQVSTPRLANIVKTGIALQGVLQSQSPSNRTNATMAEDRRRKRENLDNIFNGFNGDTGRELRAGLKFGEELARRLDSLGDPALSPCKNSTREENRIFNDIHDQTQHLPTPEETDGSDGPYYSSPNGRVIYPTLPVLPESSSSTAPAPDGGHDTPQLSSPKSQLMSAADEESEELSRTQILELEWQQEREAVIRQINEASPSKVIVIDSDDDDDEEKDSEENEGDYLACDDQGGQDDQEDEDEPSPDDGDDTGFFFQRNLPTVFERPRYTRKEDEIEYSKIFRQKDKRPGYETRISGLFRVTSPGVSEHDDYSEYSSDEGSKSATRNHDNVDDNDDSQTLDVDVVPTKDMETCDRRQFHSSSPHRWELKSASRDIDCERSLSIVPESDEDVPEKETDLWLPETAVESQVEHEDLQNITATDSYETTSPLDKSVHGTNPSQDVNSGLLARVASFFWSSLTWSAPAKPQHQPAPPHPPPVQNTLRVEALRKKYGKLSRYEPWSLQHYRTLDRMHYRKLLDPDYFSYFPQTVKGTHDDAKEPEPNSLDASLQDLVGHTERRNGFAVTFTLADVHVIAAFLALLVEPYMLSDEEVKKQAERAPGPVGEAGEIIGKDTVAVRLFGLYAGDQMRREERLGLREPPKRDSN